MKNKIFNLHTQNNSYIFDKQTKIWKENHSQPTISQQKQSELKIGTYNVLFGAPKNISLNAFTRNQKRFDHISQTLIPQQNLDTLGFCEVNQQFWDTLKQQKYIQENYQISHTEMIFKNKTHEVAMISRQKFKNYFIQQNSDNYMDRYLFTLFMDPQNLENSYMVVQAHLFAYEERAHVRKKQLEDLDNFLRNWKENLGIFQEKDDRYLEGLKLCLQNNNIIVMGDFNLHFPYETQFIYQTQFIDTWLENKGHQDPGYTWDGKENSLINGMLIFDNRRMRLDRVCLRQNQKLFKIKECSIQGKEKIGLALSASDHYMLVNKFQVLQNNKESVKQQYDFEKYKLSHFSSIKTGYRTIKEVVTLRLISFALILAIIFMIIF